MKLKIKMLVICIVMLISGLLSGCGGNYIRYSDGPLTQYLVQPLPEVKKPVASTLSLEFVYFVPAINTHGSAISDLSGGRFYFMKQLTPQVKAALRLDELYNEQNTLAAFNLIAKHNHALIEESNVATAQSASQPTTNPSTQNYIRQQEAMAQAAYKKGDYLAGNIHNGAAMNAAAIDQSFGRAQAGANLAFSIVNATASLAAAGRKSMEGKFASMKSWIEQESGIIGEQADKDKHLSIYILQFHDSVKFSVDARFREAVYLVLSDKSGIVKTVLEGSDILNCSNQCSRYTPKPTAKLIEPAKQPKMIQDLQTAEGVKELDSNGFLALHGFYQFILLKHALVKLAES